MCACVRACVCVCSIYIDLIWVVAKLPRNPESNPKRLASSGTAQDRFRHHWLSHVRAVEPADALRRGAHPAAGLELPI